MNEALEKSIKHWQEIVAGREASTGSKGCALCAAYKIKDDPVEWCYQCPVKLKTGEIFCKKTPYDDYYSFCANIETSGLKILEMPVEHQEEATKRAQAELDFLISLREP